MKCDWRTSGVMNKVLNQLTIITKLKKWKEKGHNTEFKKADKIYQRQTMRPMNPVELSTEEKKKAIGLIVFFKEKRYGSSKGQAMANGRPQQENILK